MALYTVYKDWDGKEAIVVKDGGNGETVSFPINSLDNADTIEFNKWKAAGNTPEVGN